MQTHPLRMLASIILIGLSLSNISFAQSNNLTTYDNQRFGYTVVYPSNIFQSAPSGDLASDATSPGRNETSGTAPQTDAARNGNDSVSEDGRTFISLDGRSKMVVFGGFNSENFRLEDYRATILKEFKGYDNVTYGPKGKTWFVLSGFRGDAIYYQKVLFSCSGQIINVLSITFPAEQKPSYEPIVEALEDNFRPARGRDCDQITQGAAR